ncbi:unnamed protein product [Prorocentrum cordatum]|uniref:Uncharacterized protein n=1 Tax=Prorocentrum cordatum TaxID=2364126 RepID=A0ABN9XBF6_9DINO|nr:unnamed protein product [Polarella glacialis]
MPPTTPLQARSQCGPWKMVTKLEHVARRRQRRRRRRRRAARQATPRRGRLPSTTGRRWRCSWIRWGRLTSRCRTSSRLALHGDEIFQVAAGKHHCLALSASGLVWSWGRLCWTEAQCLAAHMQRLIISEDIDSHEREIETLTRKRAEAEQAEKQVREQLQSLTKASADLDRDKEKYSEIKDRADQGDHKLFYSDKVRECEQLLVASSASRASLLEQRTDMDRERHQVSQELYKTVSEKKKLEARRQVVQDLFKPTSNTHSALDPMVKFLKDQTDFIRNHFQDRAVEHTFYVAAKHSFEQDVVFLDLVEVRLKEWFNSQPPEWKDHAAIVVDLLQDIVDLRRDWSSLLEDRWRKQDLDMSFFLDAGRRPGAGRPGAGAVARR